MKNQAKLIGKTMFYGGVATFGGLAVELVIMGICKLFLKHHDEKKEQKLEEAEIHTDNVIENEEQ